MSDSVRNAIFHRLFLGNPGFDSLPGPGVLAAGNSGSLFPAAKYPKCIPMNVRLVMGCFGMIFLAVLPSPAQTTIDSPVIVPLHFTETNSGTFKLGIYAGIGAGAVPALFEFDTGGAGFYAAYSSHAGISPWWGSHTVVTPEAPVENAYDSGLTYSGRLAAGAVSLFASAGSSTALITTATSAQIGRMNSIDQNDPSTGDLVQKLWSDGGSETGDPPIDGAFYGDFGMNLAYNMNTNSSGITNLIAQLSYGPGVTKGFRINVDPVSQQANLQIGLTAADTNNTAASYFLMNADDAAPPDATTPVAGLPYYSQQLFDATIFIQGDDGTLVSVDTGITPDTGASTTLHNTQNSPPPLPGEYPEYIAWSNAEQDLGALQDGLQFGLLDLTLEEEMVPFFEFTTSSVPNGGHVMVQNNRPANPLYYLNTGISLFYAYNLIYNMENGIIGLQPVPEPGSLVMLVLAAAAWAAPRRRRALR